MEPDLLWRERAACGHYRQLHSSRRLDRSRSVPEGRGCDFVGVVHRQTQQEAVIQGNHRERVKINRELPNRRTGVRAVMASRNVLASRSKARAWSTGLPGPQ
jgi:hypothetical protein